MTREEEISKEALEYANEEIIAAPYDAFMAGAQWADANPHWISVEDELPKKDGRYIFLQKSSIICGIIYIAMYYKSIGLNRDVTHWMPLPRVEHLRETTKMIEKGGEE